MSGRERILIVDDDASIVASLALLLKQAGYSSLSAASPDEALRRVRDDEVDLVLQDMNYSRSTTGQEGLDLLRELRAARPALPVILMTAWGSIPLAVRGVQAGASDFVTKPWSNAHLLQAVRTVLDVTRARSGLEAPTRESLDARYDFRGLAGSDPRLLRLLELVGRVAPTDAPVLVTGESGTGKELVAEALHRNSRRAGGPFIKVNLGGIPHTLFEAEMFGAVRGAFTDARADRPGRFELASGGTIFLDEIGDLDAASQVKLLRVLQDGSYEPLGSGQTRRADVRVVSATNRDLTALVSTGAFREDLLYRLNLIAIPLPPLRERRGDIGLLARRFVVAAAAVYRREPCVLTDEAARWLESLDWPGNVRQLRHLVERAVLLTDGPALEVRDFALPLDLETVSVSASAGSAATGPASPAGPGGAPPPAALAELGAMTLDEVERTMILRAIERCEGNLTRMAAALGISRTALYRRLEKHGISL